MPPETEVILCGQGWYSILGVLRLPPLRVLLSFIYLAALFGTALYYMVILFSK